MTTVTLIDAKTAADSRDFVVSSEQIPVTVSAKGQAGAEEIAINFMIGGTFESADSNDGPVTITATRKQRIINGPGRYQVVKPVTAGACLVQLDY
ncbi:MAG: hypothetical protein IPM37_23135 [Hahellaceae bacterium]|nr:hypothetical protein [Hahellaceae bacterium]